MLHRSIALAWTLAACGGAGSSPAPVADSDPTQPVDECAAFEQLRRGEIPPDLPRDAGEYWTRFERCFAPPDATECERAWTLLLALPSMAEPSEEELASQRLRYVGACETLPIEAQRCLTVHAIVDPAACEGVGARERLEAAMRRLSEGE